MREVSPFAKKAKQATGRCRRPHDASKAQGVNAASRQTRAHTSAATSRQNMNMRPPIGQF